MKFIKIMQRKEYGYSTIMMYVVLFVVVACGSVALAKESAPTFPPDSTMAKIQKSGTLVIGTKTSVPLFGQINPMTGKVEGFDTEIGRLLGQAIFGEPGHVKFVATPSAAREVSIQKDKVNLVIATYTITPERRKKVTFAGPYYFSKFAILLRKDDNAFGKKLAGWSALNKDDVSVCAATNGTNYLNVQKYAPKARLVGFRSEGKCLTLIRQHRVQMYAAEDGIILGIMSRNPGEFRMVPNVTSKAQGYGIGLKRGDTQFCKWINSQLKVMFKNGDWQKAYKHTLGSIPGVEVPNPPEAGALHYCHS